MVSIRNYSELWNYDKDSKTVFPLMDILGLYAFLTDGYSSLKSRIGLNQRGYEPVNVSSRT